MFGNLLINKIVTEIVIRTKCEYNETFLTGLLYAFYMRNYIHMVIYYKVYVYKIEFDILNNVCSYKILCMYERLTSRLV